MEYHLPTPTIEQEIIVSSLKESNIIVNAVAGSGKTTTNLMIVKEYYNSNILILTYNKKLKLDTRKKIKILNYQNVEAHSFHAFAVKYYSNSGNDDNGIDNILKLNYVPVNGFYYDIIIIDESQDIIPLYYKFICKIIKDNNKIPWLCLIGDVNQCIYTYNGSDPRFLTLADQLFNFDDRSWIRLNLSESFRITYEMSKFINCCVLNTNRIISNKHSENLVRYFSINTFNSTLTANEIKFYLENGYNYDDIFILAPSIRRGHRESPIKMLENKLVEYNYPVFVPGNDDSSLDPEEMKGKLTFSTFHQSKGLEKKVVIVFCFSSAYFKYYYRHGNKNICPNPVYVAITRGIERLTIFKNRNRLPFNFVDNSLVKTITDFHGRFIQSKKKSELMTRTKTISVNRLTQHLSYENIQNIKKYFDLKTIRPVKTIIKIPHIIKNIDGLIENVSEITGTAIPAYYELETTGKMSINIKNKPIKRDCRWLLKLANKYCAKMSGFTHKLRQINNFNWLTLGMLIQCKKRLRTLISNDAKYEVTCFRELPEEIINGQVDCIDNEKIYEFKCVQRITDQHMIQLALYLYLMKKDFGFLYNILSDELIKITSNEIRLDYMVSELLNIKNKNILFENNDKFIRKNKIILDKFYLIENSIYDEDEFL